MPLTQHRSQDGIDESRCARLTRRSRQAYRIIHDGGGRDAIEMQQLKETQAKDGEDLRIELAQWTCGEDFDEVVEASLPAERPGDDGGGQSAVAVVGK